ncbi:hypothetical protein DRB96_07390 [Streptomyces sp. ICC1]|nr:hypothetical protein DRB96_07390 [Streptomyces sp. ICC1]
MGALCTRAAPAARGGMRIGSWSRAGAGAGQGGLELGRSGRSGGPERGFRGEARGASGQVIASSLLFQLGFTRPIHSARRHRWSRFAPAARSSVASAPMVAARLGR